MGSRWGFALLVAGLIGCDAARPVISSDPGGAVVAPGTGGSGSGGDGAGGRPVAGEVDTNQGSGGGHSVLAVDASPPPPPPPPAVDAAAPIAGDVCADLVAQYRAGIELGRRCDPSSSAPQCVRAVIDSLDCACPIFINDTSAATAARLAWDRVPCPLPSAFATCRPTCPPRVPAQCLPLADGTGRCTEVRP